MVQFNKMSINKLLKYIHQYNIGEISYLHSDLTYPDDNQYIKYKIDKKNIIRPINPDLVNIYNKIILYLKQNYKKTFVINYEDYS